MRILWSWTSLKLASIHRRCRGITVMSVEIRDIMVPRGLQDALSKEAQAERERNARLQQESTQK